MGFGQHSSDTPPQVPLHSTSVAGRVTARLPTSFSLRNDSLTSNPLPKQLASYPTEWLSHYRAFVRANASQVSSIESALRSITYILPGRFNESPLTSEAVYTSLTLLSAFHTNLLSPNPNAPSAKRPPPNTRYERWCRVTGGAIYARANALLRTVQYTQLFCEMFAKRSGEKIRWRVVVFLEFVKAVCRLLMSRVSGSRPVIASSIGAESQERVTGEDGPENEKLAPEPSEGEDVIANGHVSPSDSGYGSETTSEYKMPRTGLLLPTQLPTTSSSPLSSTSSISDYLSSRAITSDELKPPYRLVHQLRTTKANLAELFYILRPVIYALALQRAATATMSSPAPPGGASNKRDWKHAWTPWLLGIGMEIVSRQLARQDMQDTMVGGWKSLSVVEREEASRRSWSIGWWVLRGGFYENVTRGIVEGVAAKLRGKPLLNMVGDVVEDYGWLWDEYYFSTATV